MDNNKTPLNIHASPTKAINIPLYKKNSSMKDNNNDDDDKYSFTYHVFDPNKFSPPSSWNNRLRARIGNESYLGVSCIKKP